jgi:hypothetical protein
MSKLKAVDQARMLRNVHSLLQKNRKYARSPNWALVSDVTGHGSTISAQICREIGWDPDARVSHALVKHLPAVGTKKPSRLQPRVDLVGRDCTSCGRGEYGETSIQDDMRGVLHCLVCGHEVQRHGEYPQS